MQPDSLVTRADTLSSGSEFASEHDSLPVHHGFSVWRIYQQMPGCTPQQLDSAVQANLPVRERVRSSRPDTLSLPYMLRNDNLVTVSLLLCLMLLVYSVNKTQRQLLQQTKNFFFPPRQKSSTFAAETSIEGSARRFMNLQLCLLCGVMLFGYSQNKFDNFLGQLSPRMLLVSYIGGFATYILLKRLLILFVNWVFFSKKKRKIWNDIYSYIVSVEAIAFFPLALAYVYFQLSYETTIVLFIFLFIITKFLLAFKTYYIFFRKSYGLFHLFVYLCALEVMPLLAIWRTLVIVTESWIVKY